MCHPGALTSSSSLKLPLPSPYLPSPYHPVITEIAITPINITTPNVRYSPHPLHLPLSVFSYLNSAHLNPPFPPFYTPSIPLPLLPPHPSAYYTTPPLATPIFFPPHPPPLSSQISTQHFPTTCAPQPHLIQTRSSFTSSTHTYLTTIWLHRK